MSSATLLDYSVLNVGVVGHQPAVMMYNTLKTALVNHRLPVTPGLGLC